MNLVYKITNRITDEVYIGKTCGSAEKRLKQHFKEAREALDGKRQSFPLFHRMIIKYGADNFYIEVLEDNIEDNSIDAREAYWIDFYDSFNNGYNSNYGNKKTNRNANVKANQKVIQYDLKGHFIKVWDSARIVGEEFEVSASNVRRNCNKKSSNCKGYIFRWYSENFPYNIEVGDIKRRSHSVPIGKYDKNTDEIIDIYSSMKEAAAETNINYQCIYNCCRGKQKTAGGYV